jgi:hypothetical protein
MSNVPEVWLRGPVAGIQPMLQPVAHALLQVGEDLPPVLRALAPDQWWVRAGGSAPIGFHVMHLAGSLDRLFTYARGEALSAEQQAALAAERTSGETRPSPAQLQELLSTRLDAALHELASVPENALLQPREVGRARLRSTTLGLLFHAAEHSTRHAGQILTLARVGLGGAQGAGAAAPDRRTR